MTCPGEGIILRLLSGELEPGRRRELQEHLETCPVCRSVYEDLQVSWAFLGDWQVDVSSIDLTARVLAEVDAEDRRPVRFLRVAASWRVPLRAAASIVVAVGLGIGAGHLLPAGRPVSVSEPFATPEGMDEVLEWVGLACESATGLPFSLEPDEAPTGDEMP